MNVTVKLYGTLSAEVTGYNHARGLEVPLPEGASIRDLLTELGIALSKYPLATIDGRIRKKEHRLLEGDQVCIFQPMHGG
jgi:sulfur carrier protein ThiS